jgi:hypothetical protein
MSLLPASEEFVSEFPSSRNLPFSSSYLLHMSGWESLLVANLGVWEDNIKMGYK